MKFTGILSKTNSRTANKIIQKDWSETSLGPIDEWPQTLKSTLLTMLENKFPVIIYWGFDLWAFTMMHTNHYWGQKTMHYARIYWKYSMKPVKPLSFPL